MKPRNAIARFGHLLILMTLGWISLMSSGYAETKKTGERESRSGKIDSLYMNPIGVVKRQGDRAFLEVNPGLAPALDGLVDFSHVWVLYWFHEHDNPADRAILKVHPRRDPANPLTGVFANRAPVRPNLIGFTACRIVKVEGSRVEVADLDARDGSPILDLKPYIPKGDAIPDARTPEWVKRISKSGD